MEHSVLTSLRIASQSTNPRSTTGLLYLNGDDTPIHYKRFTSAEVLQREAEELVRVSSVCSNIPGVRVVELHSRIDEQHLLLSYYVPSTSAFNYLWNGSRSICRRPLTGPSPAEIGARMGQWLRAYHASSKHHASESINYLHSLIDNIYGRISHIQKVAPSFLSSGQIAAIHKQLSLVKDQSARRYTGPLVTVHGDMTLDNIRLTADGDLFIVDFADSHLGYAMEDVVRLWHTIWTIVAISKARASVVTPALDAFLEAYGISPQTVQTPAFGLLRCWNALNNISGVMTVRLKLGVTGYLCGLQLARINRRWLDLYAQRGNAAWMNYS